jgi:hypothetical protein
MGHGGGAWSPAQRPGSKGSATWRGERSRRRIQNYTVCVIHQLQMFLFCIRGCGGFRGDRISSAMSVSSGCEGL